MINQSEVEFLGEIYPVVYLSGRDLSLFFEEDTTSEKPWCIDLETYANPDFPKTKSSGLLPVLSCIRTLQVFDGETVCIFDFLNKDKNAFEMHKDNFERFYNVLLERSSLIAHNALFETAHLQKYAYRYGIYQPLNIHCTMNMYSLVAHAVAASEDKRFFKRDLKTVAQNILSVDLSKEKQLSDWSVPKLSDEQIKYCALDVIAPYKIAELLLPKIDEFGMRTVFDLNTKAQEVLAHINIFGATIDIEKHSELIAEWEKKAERLKAKSQFLFNKEIEDVSPERIWEAVTDNVSEEIISLIQIEALEFSDTYFGCLQEWLTEALSVVAQGVDRKIKIQLNRLIRNIRSLIVSIDSSKQVAEWLERNLPPAELAQWPRTEKGAISTDSFAFMEAEHLETTKPLTVYKKYSKLCSTYGKSFAEWFVKHPDGTTRLHPNFTLCQTETGRMSSYEPNVQNVPSKGEGSELRRIFIPRAKDRRLVVADFSQIEIRIAAYLAEDQVLINAFDDGVDIHRLTAARTAGKRLEDVSDEERSRAKAPNFALLFGGGAGTLKKYAKKTYGIEMSLENAEKVVWAFREAYPDLYKWQKVQGEEGGSTLRATTPLGKTRKLLEDNYYCTAINFPVQGGAAELMLLSLVFVLEELVECRKGYEVHDGQFQHCKFLDAYLVNCVHDELSIDCLEKDVPFVKTLLQHCMERAMTVVFPNAGLNKIVGISSGINWLEAK